MRANPFRMINMACALAFGAWTFTHALPVSEDFEGFDPGAKEGALGNVTVTGSVHVVDDVFAQGSKSLLLGYEEFSQGAVSMFTGGEPDNVWAMVYTIPGRSDDSYFGALDDDTAFAFGVDTNGYVYAFSNNTWHVNEIGIESNVWVGFAINADYTTTPKTYDLYMTTNGYLADMERIFENLEFNDSYTSSGMSELRVETSVLQTYVDALSMQISAVELPFADGNNLMISPRRSSSSVPPPPYTYAPEQNNFGGDLGTHMKWGLQDDDEVAVFLGGSWKHYELSGGSWQGDVVEINQGDAIHLVNVQAPGFAFFPYDTRPVDPSAGLSPTGVGNGWNHLVWPHDAKTATDSADWGFSAPGGPGDRLIVYDEIDGRIRIFGWNNGWKNFPHLSAEPSYQLRRNQAFWYQRRDSDPATWTPPAN